MARRLSDNRDLNLESDLRERCYPLNTDSPHTAYLRDSDEFVRFFLIDVTGRSIDDLTSLIPTALSEMATRRAVPVFVTDLSDFEVFRKFAVIFEAVPDVVAAQMHMPQLDWAERRKDVLSLIKGKWQPSGEMNLSNAPDIFPNAVT